MVTMALAEVLPAMALAHLRAAMVGLRAEAARP